MPGSLLIKNAQIVSPDRVGTGDVWIEGGKIIEIGSCGASPAEQVIDATGLTLLPGVIDGHVHFREPGMEWKETIETGSRAAAAGGVTTYLDMPNTVPPTTTVEMLQAKRQIAAVRSAVNYGFYIGATNANLNVLNEAPGVCGIKIYMGSSTGNLLVEDAMDIEHIFANGSRLIAVHAEDEQTIRRNKARYAHSQDVRDHDQIRSVEAALKATRTAVWLAQKYNRRLHLLHLSSRDEVEFLAGERASGVVTAEVCPHHLFLSAPQIYDNLDTFSLVNPPVRTAEHARGLWEGLKKGVVDTLGSDHAPHTYEEKSMPFGLAPSGMPGVETLLPLLLNQVSLGNCSLQEVTRWTADRPAQVFGIANKGRIQRGFDADLVLVDMLRNHAIDNSALRTRAAWSPYHGWLVTGWPVITIVGGNVAFNEGEFPAGVRGREITLDAPWEKK